MSPHHLVPARASEHPMLLTLPLTREELTELGVKISDDWTQPELSTDAREELFVSAHLDEINGLCSWTQSNLVKILSPTMTPTLRATAKRLQETVETASRLESDIVNAAWNTFEMILSEEEIVRRLCIEIKSLPNISSGVREICTKPNLCRVGHIVFLGEMDLTRHNLTMGQIRELRRALALLYLTTDMKVKHAIKVGFKQSLKI